MHHQWSREELLKFPVFRSFLPVHLPTVQTRLMVNPYPKFHTLRFLIGTHFYFASEGEDEQAVPFRVYQEISALLCKDILMMAVSIYPFPVCENGHRKKDLPQRESVLNRCQRGYPRH